MGKWAGRDGRPLEGEDEEGLFRKAFPGDWRGVRRAARGEDPPDDASSARWEAALELARRALSSPVGRPGPFRSACDVYERYRYLIGDHRVEVFLVALVDSKHRLLRDFRASTGTLDGSLVHPREVFAAAVAERAAAVILVHNHPSGDPSPSPQDREVTGRLRSAGGILGIAVLDHVIIGNCTFFSFREEAGW